MSPVHPSVQLIIVAATTLYRAVWVALLAAQPNITVTGAADSATAIDLAAGQLPQDD